MKVIKYVYMIKRVLILDDDTDILFICRYILEEGGWEVHTRTDCNNIIQKVSEVEPHLIIMDNWIPDTGGMIATQILKKNPEFKSIPVIYFSANHDVRSLSLEAGAETYLEKPFDISRLEEIIEEVMKPARVSRLQP